MAAKPPKPPLEGGTYKDLCRAAHVALYGEAPLSAVDWEIVGRDIKALVGVCTASEITECARWLRSQWGEGLAATITPATIRRYLPNFHAARLDMPRAEMTETDRRATRDEYARRVYGQARLPS